jgi:hypothetical protein
MRSGKQEAFHAFQGGLRKHFRVQIVKTLA